MSNEFPITFCVGFRAPPAAKCVDCPLSAAGGLLSSQNLNFHVLLGGFASNEIAKRAAGIRALRPAPALFARIRQRSVGPWVHDGYGGPFSRSARGFHEILKFLANIPRAFT